MQTCGTRGVESQIDNSHSSDNRFAHLGNKPRVRKSPTVVTVVVKACCFS